MKQVALFAVVLVATAALLDAQSLGEVAKQEEARRKAVKASGKLYTNDSLKPEAPPTTSTPGTPAAAAAPAQVPPSPSGQPAAAGAAATAAPAAAEPQRDQAYWSGRIADEREALGRAETFRDALQSRINALTTDFTARDDPAQRAQISTDRQKALAELDRVTKEIATRQKAIADIQEEARRAGVPPGWVR